MAQRPTLVEALRSRELEAILPRAPLALAIAIAATSSAACRREPRAPPFTGERPSFVPELGAVVVKAASPGSYASALHFESFQFRSAEETHSEGRDGRATLELSGDGRASGCFGARRTVEAFRTRYASKDDKDHEWRRSETSLWAMRGRWSYAPSGWLEVAFDVVAPDVCPAPASSAPSSLSWTLRCLRLEANGVLPSAVLACTTPTTTYADALFLELVGAPTPESWLLLGDASTGLAVRSETDRYTGAWKLGFTLAPVTLTPSDWKIAHEEEGDL